MYMIMFALLLGGARAVEEWETITEEENLEMERQLKVINKPPIKSFRTEHRDIFDCIDIYKQHAFDHPLLKDHKVQMRPKRIPKETMRGKSPRFLPKHIRCPPGSVLIKRTTKEDLIMAKKVKALGLNYPKSPRFRAAPNDLVENRKGFLSAYAEYTKHNFGAKAIMNVWNPSVSSDQFSFSTISIQNGPIEKINAILAGCGVQPRLFSSNYTRLIASWTADAFSKIGCYNYICPGFVQVSSEISLGLVLNQTSTYNGPQKEIEIAIIRDGEWWLKFFNKFVGYWPQKLFTYMYGGANFVFWGGQVYSPPNEPSPAMGSGHFPEDGHDGKSAYFKQMQIWDNVNLVDPNPNYVNVHSDRPECYSVQTAQEASSFTVESFTYRKKRDFRKWKCGEFLQTDYGDIFDCIDINKQLAFDHPLLKNHTIQMKPKTIPRGMEIGTSEKEESSTLFMVKNMHVSEEQLSSANVWNTRGVPSQVIDRQAGWSVYQYLYKNYTRLYTYWTESLSFEFQLILSVVFEVFVCGSDYLSLPHDHLHALEPSWQMATKQKQVASICCVQVLFKLARRYL
ncbi:hypothetical protein REPUB_Repub07fG0195400 [Reevesia pubescens]